MVGVDVGDDAVDDGAGILERSVGGQCLVLGEWVREKGASLSFMASAAE